MNFLGRYSNSYGHLIMSLASMIAGMILELASTGPEIKGVGVTLLLTPMGYWFVSSVANRQPPTNGTVQ